jgi:RNA polymerase sigma factor (sigma-70 family)
MEVLTADRVAVSSGTRAADNHGATDRDCRLHYATPAPITQEQRERLTECVAIVAACCETRVGRKACRQLGTDEAQSLAYLKLCSKIHLYDDTLSLDRWVYTVCRNVWLDALRASRPNESGDLDTVEAAPAGDELAVEEALALLPPHLREVIRKRMDGYTQRQIAGDMGVSQQYVSECVAKAREAMQERFGEGMEDFL